MKKYIPGIIYLLVIIIVLFFYFRYINNDQKPGIIYYTVKFDLNGGLADIKDQNVYQKEKCYEPIQIPQKENNYFIGWYLNDILFDFNTPITKNITLTARWELANNNVIVDNQDNKEQNNSTNNNNNNSSNNNSNNNNNNNNNNNSNNNNNTITYTVSFNSDGGSIIQSQVIKKGEVAKNPGSPYKNGYIFLGWYLNNNIFDFNTNITKNITLLAVYQKENNNTPVIKYTVTFDSDGGSYVEPQVVIKDNKATVPTNPTKKWYNLKEWTLNGKTFNFNTPITNNITLKAKYEYSKNINLLVNEDLVQNSMNANYMKKNTLSLQSAIDFLTTNGGGTIYLPSGTYYFSQGGTSSRNERYVIRPRNNVHIIGAGTDDRSNQKTVLKPYFRCNGGYGSMDMFYSNNYSDTGYNKNGNVTTSTRRNVTYKDINGNTKTLNNETVYLINADFSNFIIDGAEVSGCTYTSDGKGFMFNLFMNSDWNNVVVKNTDATGFGMDCPINSTISNCIAINCGKLAPVNSGGASGFGIGTGYSNNESITITNSVAINNKIFGFFFEHQARFNNNYYPATTAKGFSVKDVYAGGNAYDFGGLKADNVTYTNIRSISGMNSFSSSNSLNILKTDISISSNNIYPSYFSLFSKNVKIKNSNLSAYVNDLTSFQTEIKWAINNGYMLLNNSKTFNPNNYVKRIEALDILHLYKNKEGTINPIKLADEIQYNRNLINNIGFSDLNKDEYNYYLDAVIWAYNKGIISKDVTFNPSSYITRAQLVTMLYRLKGSPNVSGTVPFNDVESNTWYTNAVIWAYKNNITNGTSSTTFEPNANLTRAQFAIMLYRYNNL